MNTQEKLAFSAACKTCVRHFFKARGVLEVDTPLLGLAPVTDPYLDAFEVPVSGVMHYLQTSPEYAMKRLLCQGSGSIYQLCKAFRVDELGRHHAPEFTMLEWYRVGFSDQDLMQEVSDLLGVLLKCQPAVRLSYEAAFKARFDIDPHATGSKALSRLQAEVRHVLGDVAGALLDTETECLQLLMSEGVEPYLSAQYGAQPVIISDYPAAQAALAKLKPHPVREGLQVAARFEVYCNGIELGNGYDELQDAAVYRARFEAENRMRKACGKPVVPVDELLLSDLLHYGLPQSAGIAMGFDRLVMLAARADSIAAVKV